MSLLVRAMAPMAAADPFDDRWYQGISWLTAAGIKVTPELAMRVSAVFACVRVIAETVASVPLPVYEDLGEGGKRRATELPLYDILRNTPNDRQTGFGWRESMTGHICLRGNGYSEIEPGEKGFVDELALRDPRTIEILETDRGQIVYRRTDRPGDPTIPADEMFHVKGLSDDGVRGLSIIEMAREAVGLSIAAETYGNSFFGKGAKPSGILEHPNRLTDEGAKRLRTSFDQTYGGAGNAGKTIVLEDGVTWKTVGMSNDDAEFLATRNFQVTDIARWFRIPPHMIGDLTRSTNNNIEHQGIEFVVYTMLPWFRRWEQQINKQLIPDTRYFAEFLIDGLLRGDIKSRYDAYAVAVQWGWMSRNEVRRLENMNPEDGLDDFLTPLNMASGSPPVPIAPPKIAPPPADTAEGNRLLAMLAQDAASRLVRKEISAVKKAGSRFASDAIGFHAWLRDFYDRHAEEVAGTLHIAEASARGYADEQRAEVARQGLAALETWEHWRSEQLAGLMLGEVV